MPFSRHRHPGSRVPVYLIFTLAKTFVLGGVVRLLWNFVLPPVTGLKDITYWQALALYLLCRILLGSTGFFNPSGGNHAGWKGKSWRSKWAQMTPEERERFQEEWRRRGKHT